MAVAKTPTSAKRITSYILPRVIFIQYFANIYFQNASAEL